MATTFYVFSAFLRQKFIGQSFLAQIP